MDNPGLRKNGYSVLGARVHAITLPGAVEDVIDSALAPRPLAGSALAVHGVVLASDDEELRFRVNSLDLVTPDGQPVRWALNWLHATHLEERVAGPDLMWEICRRAAELGLPVFLYGSKTETLNLLAQNLQKAFPGLVVAGTKASRFRQITEEESANDIDQIKESGARIVFVGLGCPRQEIWVYENRDRLGIPAIAVGAAFDYHAGLLRRAPEKMQKAGLEWLYRLMQDPARLWRRYLFLNPRFMVGVVLQRLGWREYESTGTTPDEKVRPG